MRRSKKQLERVRRFAPRRFLRATGVRAVALPAAPVGRALQTSMTAFQGLHPIVILVVLHLSTAT